MFRKLALTALTAVALSGAPAFAAGEGHVENIRFSFDGPFGTFEQNQLQRGLQVFTEVCSACHGTRYVPIRSLSDADGPGIPPDQVRAYIDQNFIEVWDADLRDFRPATPNDTFPANDAAGAPDLSLMAKARLGFHGPYGLALNSFFFGIGWPDYIASVLRGYTGEEVEQFGSVLYENTAFPSGLIGMPPPLLEDAVAYNDGTPATVEQMSEDVAAYLMWAAEPNLMARKRMGFTAVILLVILSTLLYLTNKRLWAPVKRAAKEE